MRRKRIVMQLVKQLPGIADAQLPFFAEVDLRTDEDVVDMGVVRRCSLIEAEGAQICALHIWLWVKRKNIVGNGGIGPAYRGGVCGCGHALEDRVGIVDQSAFIASEEEEPVADGATDIAAELFGVEGLRAAVILS